MENILVEPLQKIEMAVFNILAYTEALYDIKMAELSQEERAKWEKVTTNRKRQLFIEWLGVDPNQGGTSFLPQD